MSTRLNNWMAAATGTLLVAVIATGTPAQPESRGGMTDAAGAEGGEARDANAVCPWDCATGDGIVGIDDFLLLLGDWGTIGSSCDFGAGPDGIGIEDFLALLANWGPCP